MINKLYLELSQVATAKTKRELDLEDLLRSAYAIAERRGVDTDWDAFKSQIYGHSLSGVNARTFKRTITITDNKEE